MKKTARMFWKYLTNLRTKIQGNSVAHSFPGCFFSLLLLFYVTISHQGLLEGLVTFSVLIQMGAAVIYTKIFSLFLVFYNMGIHLKYTAQFHLPFNWEWKENAYRCSRKHVLKILENSQEY